MSWTIGRKLTRKSGSHYYHECTCDECKRDYEVLLSNILSGKSTRCRSCASKIKAAPRRAIRVKDHPDAPFDHQIAESIKQSKKRNKPVIVSGTLKDGTKYSLTLRAPGTDAWEMS